jgi:hypothetical protein
MDERNYGSQSERTAVLFERVAVLESLYKREMAGAAQGSCDSRRASSS